MSDNMRKTIIDPQRLALPMTVVASLAVAAIWIYAIKADASEAKALSTECKQRIESMEKQNAVFEERLNNIQNILEKIDRKLP